MNDAQTWTLIGGFLAMTTAMAVMLLRIVDAKLETVNTRFDAVDARFVALGATFESKFEMLRTEVNARIDGLDRDSQALTRHIFHRDDD